MTFSELKRPVIEKLPESNIISINKSQVKCFF